MDLKLTRRKFLQILGAAPVAGVALNLPAAMVAIPEPTIEQVVNYISDPKPKLVGGVIHLEDVRSVNTFAPEPELIQSLGGTFIPRRRHIGPLTVELEHAYHPLLRDAFDVRDECAITFDVFNQRFLVVGYLERLSLKLSYNHKDLQQTTIVLTEHVVVKPL